MDAQARRPDPSLDWHVFDRIPAAFGIINITSVSMQRQLWTDVMLSARLNVSGLSRLPMRAVLWLVAMAVLSSTGAAGASDRDFGTRRLRVRSHTSDSPTMQLVPASSTDVAQQFEGVSETLGKSFENVRETSPRYDYTYAPPNPPHAPDISPTDPGESFDSLAGTVAEIIHPIGTELSSGSAHRRVTCESACQACMVHAAENSVGVCPCYAECKQGACGDNPHVGWSSSKVSAPVEWWDAQCNIGVKHCEQECVSADFVAEVHSCQSSSNPTSCYDRLRRLHRQPDMDSRKNVMYCLREGMVRCDSFMAPPTEKEWKCYDTIDDCEVEQEILKDGVAYYDKSPSVWDSLVR